MRSRNKLMVALAALFVFAFIVLSIVLFIRNSDGGSIDKPSGEEKSSPANRNPEKFGTPDDSITFYGVSELLNSGVRLFSIEHFRNALQSYSSTSGNKINEVSIYKNSIKSREVEQGEVIIFRIRIDDSYDAEVNLISMSIRDIQIKIKSNDDRINILTPKYVEGEVQGDPNYTGDGVPPEEQP